MPTTIVKEGKGTPAAPPALQGCLAEPCFHQNVPGTGAAKKNPSAKARASVAAMSGNGNSSGNNNRALIKAISDSKVYQEYERAFNVLTGLPVSLQPVETWQLPHHGKRNENPFCALVSQNSHACAACLQAWEQLCEKAAHEPKTITCPGRTARHRRAGAVGRPAHRLSANRTASRPEADPRVSLTGPPNWWRDGVWKWIGMCSGRPTIPRKW